MKIAKVITEVSLDREFDYLVPPELEGKLRIGSAVTIPFGRSRREGVVLGFAAESAWPPEKLKAVIGPCDTRADVPEKLIELGRWIADYYCCTREQSIRTLLPAAVRRGKIRPKIRKLYHVADTKTAEQFIIDAAEKSSMKGRCAVLRALLAGGPLPIDALRLTPDFSESSLKTLVKTELVAVREEVVRKDIFGTAEVLPSAPLPPTPGQKKALEMIREMLDGSSPHRVMLLHGVTNSGKTEVYLQAIAMTLAAGRSAIVLVPEISLTPQTVRRFRARFGDELSVLHSRLSERERFDEWNRINDGEVRIVIGARSALFAPFHRLGLIIVDEEHESSYKQSEAPRYMARDVAVMRGKLENAVVILGSATPSAESMHNAKTGNFLLAEMPAQANDNRAPLMRAIDLRIGADSDNGGGSIFSSPLRAAVNQRLEAGEQTILFLNRRGYARVMICDECGFEACCPECSVNYTYSRARETLSCHLCGSVIPAYRECPQCHSPKIRYAGVGTEKIEKLARGLFPGARIARMDSDSMRSAEDYETVLGRFRRGELDILIGTQMIAKGLHFPNVTLVGIVNADMGLSMPDFRAAERTFQLITQVAGRAGRGEHRGEVYVQTRKPDNETIVHAVNLDFEGFSRYDLEFRELLEYPPFCRMIAVHFRGEDEQRVVDFASGFAEELRKYVHEGIRIAGPTPAPIERVKGKFRYMLTVRGRRLRLLRQALRVLALHRPPAPGVEVDVDVDPQSLL